jgi:hypothetical protein
MSKKPTKTPNPALVERALAFIDETIERAQEAEKGLDEQAMVLDQFQSELEQMAEILPLLAAEFNKALQEEEALFLTGTPEEQRAVAAAFKEASKRREAEKSLQDPDAVLEAFEKRIQRKDPSIRLL